ncbi:MAG: SCO family protein [Microthrixaceae bacterium]
MYRPRSSRLVVLAAALSAALLAVSCSNTGTTKDAAPDKQASTTPEPTEFSGYVRTPPLDVSSVTLPAVSGELVNMVAEPGGLRIVYFGYTTCPDVCPMTLGHVKVALGDQTATDRERVQVDMITIDPSRDTSEKLTAYLDNFVSDANALRTEDPYLLRASAKAFGADFSVSVDGEGKRQVAHTADVYVVDDTGIVVLAWAFGTAGGDISRDLSKLLAGDRPGRDEPADDTTGTTIREEQ